MSSRPSTTDPATAAEALKPHERFLVTTHEAPDGDALGSMLATKLALEQLGKDAVMFLTGAVPFPREYHFMSLSEVRRGSPPADAGDHGPGVARLDRRPRGVRVQPAPLVEQHPLCTFEHQPAAVGEGGERRRPDDPHRGRELLIERDELVDCREPVRARHARRVYPQDCPTGW